MKCPNCNNVISQEDQFCGRCGFHLGSNMPTLLSNRQAPVFYSAPTVASLDTASAMVAIDNPYSSLLPGLNISRLILNDDDKRVWSEKRAITGKAWYENKGVFHLIGQGNGVEAEIQRMSVIHVFTLQAVVEFQQELIVQNSLSFTLDRPDGSLLWSVFLAAKGEHGDKTVWTTVNGEDDLNLKHPSYEPFLLGVVRLTGETYIFVNLEHLATLSQDEDDAEESLLGLYALGNATVSHTRVWVP